MPNEVTSHEGKCQALLQLCKNSADLDDTRIQSYLARYLAIMVSAYVEIYVRETLSEYAKRRASPTLASYVSKTIEWENSLNCEKIGIILARFGKPISELWGNSLTDDEKNAIDSIKTLRDQLAHGRDNGTSYLVVGKYFTHIRSATAKIDTILN